MQTENINQDRFPKSSSRGFNWRTLTPLLTPHPTSKLPYERAPGIAWMNHAYRGIRQLLFFIVLINFNLAILNLLPRPISTESNRISPTVNKQRASQSLSMDRRPPKRIRRPAFALMPILSAFGMSVSGGVERENALKKLNRTKSACFSTRSNKWRSG
jgi:hypothetical protein